MQPPASCDSRSRHLSPPHSQPLSVSELVHFVYTACMKKLFVALVFSWLLCAFLPLQALEIYRPENFGALNTIPCLIRVTDQAGNDASDRISHLSYNWYYEIPLPNWSRQPESLNRYFNGCFTGGVVVHLLMQPGIYEISVYTPVDKQQDYKIAQVHTSGSAATETESTEAAPREWTSNTFTYNTAHKPNVIFISPVANENGFFCGSWHIDYKAPRFFKYTKPLMQR